MFVIWRRFDWDHKASKKILETSKVYEEILNLLRPVSDFPPPKTRHIAPSAILST